jgi:hypothetical protein
MMATRFGRVGTRSLWAPCVASLVLAACGGAAPPPLQTPAPAGAGAAASTGGDDEEPRSIEEAQAQLARARADLDGRPREAEKAHDTSTGVRPGKAPNAPSPESATKNADACADACRAIRSMRKAVGAICRMAGDTDPRCSDARATLATSEKRSAACGC